MKCRLCERNFPDHLLAPFIVGAGGNLLEVISCPICALRERNIIFGVPEDTPFHGEIARAMYEEAVEFLRRKVK